MKTKNIWKDWVLPLALEILAIFLFIKFVAFAVYVPSGSMLPTIQVPSLLVATRVYSPEKSVERGDIVAFNSQELEKVLIKRCIGLPGDEVELEEGRLYINGEYVEEPYVVNTYPDDGSWIVPEGCYFFLGDNRSGSFDAREWDDPYIEGKEIIGEARFTVYPFSNFGFLN